MKSKLITILSISIIALTIYTIASVEKETDEQNLQARPEPVLRLDIQELQKHKEKIESEEKTKTIREITAYNLVEWQTDGSPCIGASGDDLCELLDQGIKVCAANFVKLGTILEIESVGRCVVLDRTNSRYKNRVDLAMKAGEISLAKNFGIKKLEVKIINNYE